MEHGKIDYILLINNLRNKDKSWWIQYFDKKSHLIPFSVNFMMPEIIKKIKNFFENNPSMLRDIFKEISQEQLLNKSELRKAFIKAK